MTSSFFNGRAILSHLRRAADDVGRRQETVGYRLQVVAVRRLDRRVRCDGLNVTTRG